MVSGGETSFHVRPPSVGAQDLAVAAADPRDALVDGIEPAVLLVGAGRHRLPAPLSIVGRGRGGQQEGEDEDHEGCSAHDRSLPAA